MPNRIIKESITTSENIDRLTPFQETVFYRLIVVCDDYGRMDARPKLLASRLFPLRDIRPTQIEDALRALTSAELVYLYEVDGKPFLQMNTWDKHQRVRNSIGKYPAPESGTRIAASCGESRQVAADCGPNPIQSESESNPNPKHAQEMQERFERFWNAYPRHTAKQNALKAFLKVAPDEALLERMLAAIASQKESDQWTKDGGQFIPHPATWLNQERWNDELPKAAPKKTVVAQQYEQRDYSQQEAEPMPDWMMERWKQMQEGTA